MKKNFPIKPTPTILTVETVIADVDVIKVNLKSGTVLYVVAVVDTKGALVATAAFDSAEMADCAVILLDFIRGYDGVGSCKIKNYGSYDAFKQSIVQLYQNVEDGNF